MAAPDKPIAPSNPIHPSSPIFQPPSFSRPLKLIAASIGSGPDIPKPTSNQWFAHPGFSQGSGGDGGLGGFDGGLVVAPQSVAGTMYLVVGTSDCALPMNAKQMTQIPMTTTAIVVKNNF